MSAANNPSSAARHSLFPDQSKGSLASYLGTTIPVNSAHTKKGQTYAIIGSNSSNGIISSCIQLTPQIVRSCINIILQTICAYSVRIIFTSNLFIISITPHFLLSCCCRLTCINPGVGPPASALQLLSCIAINAKIVGSIPWLSPALWK
jgi:hypothetical protein